RLVKTDRVSPAGRLAVIADIDAGPAQPPQITFLTPIRPGEIEGGEQAHDGTFSEHCSRVNGQACNPAVRRQIGAMSSLRMPQSLARRLGVDTGEAVLRYELLEEQAAALGRAGAKLEQALAAL